MTTKTIDLVIARYNENLDWLKAYEKYNFNKIYVYNKGATPIRLPDPFHAKAIYEDLENVGRCDHTYIHHICIHVCMHIVCMYVYIYINTPLTSETRV